MGTGSASRPVSQVVITSNFRASSMNFGMSAGGLCFCRMRVIRQVLQSALSFRNCSWSWRWSSSPALPGMGAYRKAPRNEALMRGSCEDSKAFSGCSGAPLAQQTVRLTPCARTCSFPPLESKRVSHVAQKAGRAVATLDGGSELALQHLHHRRMAGLRVVRLSRESAPPKLMPSVYFTQATT